ncbi:hypothetical protein [Cetobacterium sp.]|uniref:hypothetical protein n=1 Tax=Cetobacterium sp. TaxID=2071632 RepID=UPI003F343EFA
MELVNRELTLLDLDNKMIEMGYYTEFEGDVKAWLRDENVVYTKCSEEQEQVQVFFKVKYTADTKQENILATIVKVVSIEEV